MKSTEAYKTLRVHLAPVLQEAHFKRAKGLLSWARDQDDRYLVVWCQVSQSGRDDYAGSQFAVEFQLSDKAIVGAPHVRRQRFPKILDGTGREEIRVIQNQVVGSLRRPPPNHPLLRGPETIRAFYLERFHRIDEPYTEGDDIWLRYENEEHLATWA